MTVTDNGTIHKASKQGINLANAGFFVHFSAAIPSGLYKRSDSDIQSG